MKTVTHKGKVYQLFATYCTPDSQAGELLKFDSSKDCPFVIRVLIDDGSSVEIPCKVIYTVGGIIGTIEDAPLELEAGEWYMCKSKNSAYNTALFYKGGELLDNDHCGIDISEHFEPLYKMVKAN